MNPLDQEFTKLKDPMEIRKQMIEWSMDIPEISQAIPGVFTVDRANSDNTYWKCDDND